VNLPAPSHSQQTFLLIESDDFSTDVDKLLGSNEKRGLFLILADNPLCGTPFANVPGVLFVDFAKCRIYYTISINTRKIFLLSVHVLEQDPPPPGNSSDFTDPRNIAKSLAQGGLISIGKRLMDWIIDLIK
jgi:hypothetical protein